MFTWMCCFSCALSFPYILSVYLSLTLSVSLFHSYAQSRATHCDTYYHSRIHTNKTFPCLITMKRSLLTTNRLALTLWFCPSFTVPLQQEFPPLLLQHMPQVTQLAHVEVAEGRQLVSVDLVGFIVCPSTSITATIRHTV